MATKLKELNLEADQLSDFISETTEYFIICDWCRGCTDLETYGIGLTLYEQGWRITENPAGREMATCPDCVGKHSTRG